jgi:uncharacterized protein (DUF488 family)
VQLSTIGFSGKSAERFFAILSEAGVQKLIDVRRSNNTLYCGFTRARDLPYLLKSICGVPYVHEPEFAPSLDLLRDYQARLKRDKHDPAIWADYVPRFLAEIAARPVLKRFHAHTRGLERVCFLCTEATPEHCHRRLLAGYIADHARDSIEIVHL